jgi:CHAT domain-containing protein
MIKLKCCLLTLLVIVTGCQVGANGSPAAWPQEASGKPLVLNEEVENASASPEEPFLKLKQKLEQGRYEEVIRGAGAAYDRTETRDPVWAWRFRLLQARATGRNLDFDVALALLNIKPPARLSIEEFAGKDIITAEVLCAQERKQEGIAALDRAKPLLVAPSINPVLNAEWLFFRGKCEPFTSEAARGFFERAGKLAHGKDTWLEAASSIMLAYRLALLERFDEALDRYQPVLSQTREIGSQVLEEGIMGYMAQSYNELGQFEKGKEYALRAEQIAGELDRVDHQARHLIDAGIDEQSRGRLAEAEEFYLKAISLVRKDGKQDAGFKLIKDDIVARCLNNLTTIELQRQSLERAEDYHLQAASLMKKKKVNDDDLLTWKLSHIDLALARKDHPSALSDLAQLFSQKEQGFRLLWSAQQRMARTYESMGNLHEADKWYRATIDTAVKSSAKLNHQEYKTSVLSNLDFFSDYIEFLIRTNRPNQALQVAEIGRARALDTRLDHSLPGEDTGAWLAEVQKGLRRSGKIALAYWESKTQVYAWLVTASQVKLVQQAHGTRELERLVVGYQEQIAKRPEGAWAAQKLYGILVQPFESLIPKGSHVVIVAHGNLYEVNFESLVVPGPALHYWIEDVSLENAISLNHVINSSQPHQYYKKDMLAIGAAVQVDALFPPLPNASDEIERVTKPFPPKQKQVFTGENATPQAFLASHLEQYRYIHITAHGTNVALDPMNSAIILSRGKNNSYKLYARDIVELKVPIQAELVTISSCNSAGIPVNDLGGPIGLSSAFLHAGAHQVIAALWKVSDTATPQLMDQFYSELARGKTVSEALHEAKLTILRNKQYQAPFYWATLQLYSRT